MRWELKSPVETDGSSPYQFHKVGSLSLHFASSRGFKFLLEKLSAKFTSKLIGKVDSVLRAERIENFICELVGFDVHISRVPIQVGAHANAFAVSLIVHEHQHERKFVAHPLLHKLPLLFHVSWKHQWFSVHV